MPTILFLLFAEINLKSGHIRFGFTLSAFSTSRTQILDIPPAVQHAADLLQDLLAVRSPASRRRISRKEISSSVDPCRLHPLEVLARLLELWPLRFVARSQFFEHHVQLENFFEQLRRHIFRPLLADIGNPSSLSRYSARFTGSLSVR